MTQNETPPSVPYADESTPAHASSAHNLWVLAIAILGLYFVLMSVRDAATLAVLLIFSLRRMLDELSVAILVVPVINLSLGILLIARAPSIARRIYGTYATTLSLGRLQYFELQAIAFSVAGVLLLVWGVVGASRHLIVLQHRELGLAPDDWYGLLPYAVQLILGLALFFQARGLANLWQRVRQSPTEPNTPTERESASE